MAFPLPEDVKRRGEQRCAESGYLTAQDPGTVIHTEDGSC